jgi:hypothetical protein
LIERIVKAEKKIMVILRISAKSISVTVEADHPVGPSRSGRSDAGLLLV